MERLVEYRTYNAQFCKRIFDYLSIMIVAQVSAVHCMYYNQASYRFKSKLILDDNGGITRPKGRGRPIIFNHQGMESYLGRYAGLLLYLKEMDETVYSKFCAVRHLKVQAYNVNSLFARRTSLQLVTFTAAR